MKIAHVVTLQESVPPLAKNGLEFVVSWLAEELISRGHEVTLFAAADSKTNGKLISLLPKGTHHDNETWRGQPFWSIWNTVLAGSHSENFDIIHCHDFFGSFIAPFIKTPIVQTLHHPFVNEFLPQFLKTEENAQTLQFVSDQYAAINYVSVSRNQEHDFMAMKDFYFKKHRMIYNGIPVSRFEFNPTPQEYLFYIGYMNKDKGADAAVRVARALGMKLILAGNNFGQEEFFYENIKPYLGDDIKYVGPVDFDQKVELYKNAYATLAPLHWAEPFGLTLVESQACGTPVIAFNKGAATEIIKDGETGFVVETETDMIEAVKKIGTISRQRCRTWIEQNFSVSSMVDAYEKYYADILGKKDAT